MTEPTLTILAIADLHYTGLARQTAQSPRIHGELARTLLKKVFLRLSHMGVTPDVALLLGDLTENGTDRNARLDLTSLLGELTRSGIPYLAAAGNHDPEDTTLPDLFDSHPGLHKIGGYGIVLFNDPINEKHEYTRDAENLASVQDIAKANPGLPLIAVQHAPSYPAIDSHYPYRPTNTAEIIESFRKAGVFLSISGHYHPGQKPRAHEGILYHTVPALSEAPFRFCLIRVTGRHAEVEDLSLALTAPHITDIHCHTEHAYCGTTIDTAPAAALSSALGLSALCLTEHAFQLYFDKKTAMSFKWQSAPAAAEAVWQTPARHRMAAFRKFAQKLRSPFVKIGLEVDLFDNGRLLVAPDDLAEDWDLLVGAVHFIQGYVRGQTSQQEAEKLFLRDLERLTNHDIHVLAHPFRFFARNGLAHPRHLYGEVAGLLADTGVAAEINFHTYTPDAEFIRACLDKGAKIALASDAHDLAEVGEFWPHLALLKEAGVTSKMFPDVIFTP